MLNEDWNEFFYVFRFEHVLKKAFFNWNSSIKKV